MIPFCVLIPARLNSSRLANKALADLAGMPMVVRVAKQALKSNAKRVIVATDTAEILTACQQHHIEVVMTSADHQSGTDRLAEAVNTLGLADDMLVVNVQGDEPLIDPQLINQLAYHLAQDDTEMATIAHPIANIADFHNPNIVKVILNQRKHALYFSRSPIPYPRISAGETLPTDMAVLRHIGIYAYRVPFLNQYHQLQSCSLETTESLEQLRVLWYGYTISVLISATIPHAGVDTVEDLARVRSIFENRS